MPVQRCLKVPMFEFYGSLVTGLSINIGLLAYFINPFKCPKKPLPVPPEATRTPLSRTYEKFGTLSMYIDSTQTQLIQWRS